MQKHSTSQLVKCPVCQKDTKTRGLHSHLRLMHPEVDAKQKLRNVIINPLNNGNRIIFQIALTPENEYHVKHTSLNNDDMEFIVNLIFALKKGHKLTGLAGGRWDGSFTGTE
jgi:hypothetical protein